MSGFTIYPAIDLRDGKAVRLVQGRAEQQTVYGDDPSAIARDFEASGATWLHVVNLDGAFGQQSANLDVLGRICTAVRVPVQLGGGLRTLADVDRAFLAGAQRVVLGTVALREPALVARLAKRYGPALAVGLDARDGRIAVSGWTEVSEVTTGELARRMIDSGVQRFIYTDIARDGMLTGPDLAGAAQLAALGAKVIASGGVGSLQHVTHAVKTKPPLDGVIVGKALYEGRFTLNQALASIATA